MRFYLQKDSLYFIPVITLLLALLTAVSPFSTDTYLPAIPAMADFFKVPIHQIQISLSVYFFGVAVGQFLGGPISDSFGRKKVALAGLLIFGLSSLAILFISSVEMLWLFRFTQAIGGGMASVVNMAFVRDWFEGTQIARMSSLITMVMMLAPLVSPIIGSSLTIHHGWHSIFVFLCILSLLIISLFVFLVPESRDKIYLTNRIHGRQFFESYKKVFQYKQVVFLVLCNSFAISGMFSFITSASFIYMEYFHVSVAVFPYLFGTNVLLNILLSFANYKLVKNIHPAKLLHIGLILQLVSGIVLYITTHQSHPQFWFVFIPIVFYMGSMGLLFGNVVALILQKFPDISGSANAVIGVSRFALSSLVATILAYFQSDNLIPFGNVLLLCTVLAYIFFTLSEKYRKVSKENN